MGSPEKAGLTFEDHHFKNTLTNRTERSPPKKLKELYDYLPTDDSPHHAKFHTPTKVSIEAEINSLGAQTHCIGVYAMVEHREHNAKPMYKHATADLVLIADTIDGQDGWMVAQWTTLKDTKKEIRSCLRVVTEGQGQFPFQGTWQMWSGREWKDAPSLKCRPTYHGWGNDYLNLEACHNTLSSAQSDQKQGKLSPSRTRGVRSGSPNKNS